MKTARSESYLLSWLAIAVLVSACGGGATRAGTHHEVTVPTQTPSPTASTRPAPAPTPSTRPAPSPTAASAPQATPTPTTRPVLAARWGNKVSKYGLRIGDIVRDCTPPMKFDGMDIPGS